MQPLFLNLFWSYLPELLVAFYKLQHFCQVLLKSVSLLEIKFWINSLKSFQVLCSFLDMATVWHGLQYVKVCNCTGAICFKKNQFKLGFFREFQQGIVKSIQVI